MSPSSGTNVGLFDVMADVQSSDMAEGSRSRGL